MPLLFDSSPPTTHAWCAPPRRAPRRPSSTIRPSLSSSVSPGLHVARQLLVVEADALVVARARCSAASSTKRLRPAPASILPSSNLPTRIFGPCRSAMIATSCRRAWRRLAHQRGAVDVVLRRAVREVEAHHVDAGADHPLEHLGRGRRGAEGGDDLGLASGHVGLFQAPRDRWSNNGEGLKRRRLKTGKEPAAPGERAWRVRTPGSARGAGGVGHRQRRHVDDAPHGGRRRQDVHRPAPRRAGSGRP